MTVTGYIFLKDMEEKEKEIERQRHILERYGVAKNLHVDHICVENDVSPKRPFYERNRGEQIVATAKPNDVILVEKAEWVLGSAKTGLRLIGMLRAQSTSLYCIDLDENISMPGERKLVVYEGGADLVRRLLESLAVCEAIRHGDSIKRAKKEMKKEGKYLGGPVPFGWRVSDGFLVEDSEQQEIISHIRELRADRWSYRDIARKLKENFAIQLSHEGIRKILLSEGKS